MGTEPDPQSILESLRAPSADTPKSADVIPLPFRRRPAADSSPEELERWARAALNRPRTGTTTDEIAGLHMLGMVAFNACAAARLDGQSEAIATAGNLLLEMNRRLDTLQLNMPDPELLKHHPIDNDLAEVRALAQGDSPEIEVMHLQSIVSLVEAAIERSFRAGSVEDLPQVGSMISTLGKRLNQLLLAVQPGTSSEVPAAH